MKGNAMRRFLILAVLIMLLVLTTGFSSQVALATARPLNPGHPLFPLQDFAEQVRGRLIVDETKRAIYHLDLAMQRTEDLVILRESQHAQLAINYLEQALDQTLVSISRAPEGDLPTLEDQLRTLVLNINVALSGFTGLTPDQELGIENLQAKIFTLATILAGFSSEDQLASNPGNGQSFSDMALAFVENADQGRSGVAPQIVEFPPGSPGAMHEFFPLEGEHAELDCLACHTDAQYAGTANLCSDCHLEEIPDPHFSGECSICHSAFSWQQIDFDHSQNYAVDCLDCHLEEEPDNHYKAQCSACHNTTAWARANFDHQAVNTKDCQSCHSNNKPTNHYSGQCSACHNTTNWSQVNFNHEAVGATDCKACHTNERPANHWSGQCSACHNTSNWSQANFNHQAVGATDCKACHTVMKGRPTTGVVSAQPATTLRTGRKRISTTRRWGLQIAKPVTLERSLLTIGADSAQPVTILRTGRRRISTTAQLVRRTAKPVTLERHLPTIGVGSAQPVIILRTGRRRISITAQLVQQIARPVTLEKNRVTILTGSARSVTIPPPGVGLPLITASQ